MDCLTVDNRITIESILSPFVWDQVLNNLYIHICSLEKVFKIKH